MLVYCLLFLNDLWLLMEKIEMYSPVEEEDWCTLYSACTIGHTKKCIMSVVICLNDLIEENSSSNTC